MSKNVLIACEFSGIVRDAFIEEGCNAVSCDLLPSERDGPHYQEDVLAIMMLGWDLMIAHPPCTYLAVSGLHWNKKIPGRQEKTEAALSFVDKLLKAPIPHIALENPVGCISTRIRKPDQYIQPYEFGEDASKKTGLWLKNLPKLVPTEIVPPKKINDKELWGNQTPSGQNKLGPSEDRWKDRSRTYEGIARAMAQQWSRFI